MKTDFISLSDLKSSVFKNDKLEIKEKQRKEVIGINNISETDIAIIGISGKFGKANNLNDYWDLLINEEELIRDIPINRKKDADNYLEYSGIKNKNKDVNYTKIAYLDEINKFDCDFFEIIPNEAKLIDPRQRLFVETAWNALEDAGYGGGKLCGTKTGIYVGLSSDGSNEYFKLIEKGNQSLLGLATAGNIKSVIASRLAYILDFKGPTMVIDTACSSSLVTLHTACQALRNRDCDTALVGGVNIKVFPKTEEENKWNIGITSSDSIVKTFDNEADGTNSGEGVAAILLKPLKNAILDKDQIYAVIKGSAINQDGSSVGITAPNVTAQENVILDAWKDAHIDPKTITYIEAHGTGTKLGDPIEVSAIQQAFSKFTDRKQFCAISSVKTNIGHLDSLAGLAGLIKAVMALKHKKIPPSLNFKVPNRNINFHESPVYVNDRVQDWINNDGVYRCGVSSFGLSGTNCHVILEEAPKIEQHEETVFSENIFTVSARTKKSLFNLLNRYVEFLGKEKEVKLHDICYTVNTGRLANKFRLALIIKTKEELLEKLELLVRSEWKTYPDKDIYFQMIEKNTRFIGRSIFFTRINESHTSHQIKRIINRIRKDITHINKCDLQFLSEVYCNGADVNFEELYRQFNFQKVSLPTYSFDGKRLWIDLKEKSNSISSEKDKHPLINNLVLQSFNMEVYVSHLNVKDHWILNEHKVENSYVVPGTTYIDTAREIGKRYFGDSWNIVLKNVMFPHLLQVKDVETREVHTIINIKEDALEFSVVSKLGEVEWVKHAEALIVKEVKERPKKYDIEVLKKNYESVYIIQKNNRSLVDVNQKDYESVYFIEDTNRSESIVSVGDRWKCTNAIYRNSEGVLCELEIKKEYQNDFDCYSLHPAMMDCAVNAATFTINDESYLPYYYKNFRIFGSTPKKFYSYITKKTNDNEETGKFDILLLNEAGEVFGEISNYIVKKVHGSTEKIDKSKQMYHKLAWVSKKDYILERKYDNRNILLFKNEGELSNKIAKQLRVDGKSVIEVELGKQFSKISNWKYTIRGEQEDYDKLFEAIENENINQIIHLMTINNETDEELLQLQKKLSIGLESLFYLTKSIMKNTKNSMELLLFTDFAHRVNGEEFKIKPHNAAFFGFGKVIEKEYPKLSVRCIDIDDKICVEDCITEINSKKQVELVAYRDKDKYVQELQNVDIKALPEEKVEFKKDGVYVITGGMGGIGLEMAKYISSKENVNLILIGRSGLSATASEKSKIAYKIKTINEIQESGSRVECYKANVANEHEIKEVFREIRKKFNKIDGVIHGAGVSGEGFIFRKEKEVFDNVIKPKIHGTWIMNQLTKDDQLDFFIMFSSITSLGGSMGQADYAAANAYMDSFEEFRSLVVPEQKTLTINWCGWNDVGMLAEYIDKRKEEHKDNNGFKTINSIEAIYTFDEIIQKEISKVIIGEIDYKVLGVHKGLIKFLISSDILQRIDQTVSKEKISEEMNFVRVNHIDYNSIENKILKVWIKVLGLEQIGIDDKFYDLGGDSISAIYLMKEIEKEFPSRIDVSDIFTYPSIREMALYIESELKNDDDCVPSQIFEDHHKEDDIDTILSKLASGELEVGEANKLIYSGQKS
ncbi:SDR family NAD(P)-dependent oxidoreductase [Bacillus cereus]|nr:SDR family NAD(P)-dependent oxidoreductase [Bacillus cereus]MCU4857931.1 SDR family NAD(P)-dependent oxidoreductase [Bacillus cereus]MCU4874699.1 SDR family NAD(P)-dependent oxidoreductase [Bacillus cereus]MCU4942913.1 SDR family NAD(P)-dependent oxidoreductase [Bacillus cereus]